MIEDRHILRARRRAQAQQIVKARQNVHVPSLRCLLEMFDITAAVQHVLLLMLSAGACPPAKHAQSRRATMMKAVASVCKDAGSHVQ
jgi:hypothetical protein